MKIAFWQKLTNGIKGSALVLLVANLVIGTSYANDPDVTVTPLIYHFPNVQLGTSSPIKTIEVRNTHGSNTLVIGTPIITGVHASQFSKGTDNCDGQSLPPANFCGIDITFDPDSFGSKMATLEIPVDATNTANLVVFLSNDEDIETEARRRLPPVIYSLSIPETMDSSTGYTLDWSILGYHKDYESEIVLFDCNGQAPLDCGSAHGDPEQFATSGMKSPDSTTPRPEWNYKGKQAVEHHFSYSFNATTESFPQVGSSGTHPIVVRFYQRNNMDVMSNEAGVSVTIPGNLTNIYYDQEGRRIQKDINVP